MIDRSASLEMQRQQSRSEGNGLSVTLAIAYVRRTMGPRTIITGARAMTADERAELEFSGSAFYVDFEIGAGPETFLVWCEMGSVYGEF